MAGSVSEFYGPIGPLKKIVLAAVISPGLRFFIASLAAGPQTLSICLISFPISLLNSLACSSV
ncbi:MAG: hypothetical protein PWR10_2409 [Halanaerobiales bacterium]|nr:hypothetical protein [Halanaerobiales bacterium]